MRLTSEWHLRDAQPGNNDAAVMGQLKFCPSVHKSRLVHGNERADFIGLAVCMLYVHNVCVKYGYARVSTDGQSVGAQVEQLTNAGAAKVFKETASGARTDRAQLRRLLNALEKGDVLIVTRLDRLARSTRDLLNILATIAEKKAGF